MHNPTCLYDFFMIFFNSRTRALYFLFIEAIHHRAAATQKYERRGHQGPTQHRNMQLLYFRLYPANAAAIRIEGAGFVLATMFKRFNYGAFHGNYRHETVDLSCQPWMLFLFSVDDFWKGETRGICLVGEGREGWGADSGYLRSWLGSQ